MILYIAIAVVLILIVVGYIAMAPPMEPDSPPGAEDAGDYWFFPNVLMSNGNINFNSTNVADLKDKCNANPACKAFATSGWGYSSMQAHNSWSTGYYPTMRDKGVYVKKSIKGYY